MEADLTILEEDIHATRTALQDTESKLEEGRRVLAELKEERRLLRKEIEDIKAHAKALEGDL